jgi:hypothetical protein
MVICRLALSDHYRSKVFAWRQLPARGRRSWPDPGWHTPASNSFDFFPLLRYKFFLILTDI